MHTTSTKYSRLLFLMLWCLISCNTTNNVTGGFSMQTTKNNATPRHYKKIMITGFGASDARLIFENLYSPLSAALLKENITTEENFTRDNFADMASGLNKQERSYSYDAILIVIPQPIDFAAEKNISNAARTKPAGRNFKLAMLDRHSINNSIWELILNLNIDFTQAKFYEIVAEKILENMRLNKLVK